MIWGNQTPWWAALIILLIVFAPFLFAFVLFALNVKRALGGKGIAPGPEAPANQQPADGAEPRSRSWEMVCLYLSFTAVGLSLISNHVREDTWVGWYVVRNRMVVWLLAFTLNAVFIYSKRNVRLGSLGQAILLGYFLLNFFFRW